jgi:putative oxidoreductase
MHTAQILTAWTSDALALSAGVLAARLVLGLLMAGHGAQKLFGWFGGPGLDGAAGFFAMLGFRPARLMATVAAGTEIVSGLLVALGFLGPVGPALMLSVMIVAMSVHWRHGLFAQSNGIEVALLYAAGAFALALVGPGLFSLDALLDLQGLRSARLAWIALGVGVVAGVANLAARRPPAAVPTA